MDTDLTRRQRQFLTQFINYFQKIGEAVHYPSLAKYLGLGKVSVYEMLRLLEDRGLVNSHYKFNSPTGQRGPGRPTVVFQPTPTGFHQIQPKEQPLPTLTHANRAFKRDLLRSLSDLREGGAEWLQNTLINQLPKRRSNLNFSMEAMTALLISLNTVPDRALIQPILQKLMDLKALSELEGAISPKLRSSLEPLSKVNRASREALLTHFKRLTNIVDHFNDQTSAFLIEFIHDAAKILANA